MHVITETIPEIEEKIGKKSDFRCRPPKTDFGYLIYTPKKHKKKKVVF